MKYQQILYARSWEVDYRWIKTSNYLSNEELQALKRLFSASKSYADSRTKESPLNLYPIHLLSFLHADALIRYRNAPAHFVDFQTRTIHALEGIVVPHEYRRHLWFLVPFLLSSDSRLLDGTSDFDPIRADQFKDFIDSKELSLSNFDLPLMYDSSYSETMLDSALKFNSAGMQKLVTSLTNPAFGFVDFMFGATPRMLDIYANAKIVVMMQDLSKERYKTNVPNSDALHLATAKPENPPEFNVTHINVTTKDSIPSVKELFEQSNNITNQTHEQRKSDAPNNGKDRNSLVDELLYLLFRKK